MPRFEVNVQSQIEAAHFTRFSRGCKYPDSDYRVEFDGCQRLQRFQWKLAQLLPAIEGNIAVIRTFEEQWSEKARSASVQASLAQARGLVKQHDFHRESVRKLAEQAQCCSEFVSPISPDMNCLILTIRLLSPALHCSCTGYSTTRTVTRCKALTPLCAIHWVHWIRRQKCSPRMGNRRRRTQSQSEH